MVKTHTRNCVVTHGRKTHKIINNHCFRMERQLFKKTHFNNEDTFYLFKMELTFRREALQVNGFPSRLLQEGEGMFT